MDPKVLRAAVSAAIRVTVSTTLIGCGGNVTGGNAQGTPPGSDSPASSAEPPPNDAPTWSPSGVGSVSNAGSGGSGVAQGGIAQGGGASEGGSSEGGESPVEPVDTCGAVDACLNRFDAQAPMAPLGDADEACCRTVTDGLLSLQVAASAECWPDLNRRFMLSSAYQVCCAPREAWQVQACSPWGPPVPPELPERALRAWGAAA